MLRDGIEAGTNVGFVLVFGILHHIRTILLEDRFPYLIHFIHVPRLYQGIDGSRKSAYGNITVQQRLHGYMDALWYRFLLCQTTLQHIDDFLAHIVGPKELLKVERVHLYNLFVAHRN